MLLRTCTRLPRRCSARDVSTATTASRTRGRLALGGAAAVAAAGIGAYALDYVGRTRKVDEVFAFDRDLKTVVATAERATRVGFEARVGHELQALREWHAARGYLGGIVLRSLDEGVYSNAPAAAAAPDGPPVLHAERECYYLYYEVLPNGQRVQQLFVRGTANLADVKTDLKTTLVYVASSHVHCCMRPTHSLLPPGTTRSSGATSTRDSEQRPRACWTTWLRCWCATRAARSSWPATASAAPWRCCAP